MSFDVERRLKSGNLKSVPLADRDPGRTARQRARNGGIGASKIVVKPEDRKRSGIFAAIAALASMFPGRRQ
jgi:hypothetical protein